MVRKKSNKQPQIRNDVKKKPQTKRKKYNKAYNHYKEHLKSKEFKEVRKLVIARDKVCQFCGRSEEELVLPSGRKLSWNIHHLPQGYLHLDDSPEEEAKYCRLFCSACHRAAHNALTNKGRFTQQFTKDIGKNEDGELE